MSKSSANKTKNNKNNKKEKSKSAHTRNKSKKVDKKPEGGGKRGRPAGSKNKSKQKTNNFTNITDIDPDYIPPKSYKSLGYCPAKGCHLSINVSDLVTKFIFVCPRCGKRARISKLLEASPFNRGVISKKEFLSTTNAVI